MSKLIRIFLQSAVLTTGLIGILGSGGGGGGDTAPSPPTNSPPTTPTPDTTAPVISLLGEKSLSLQVNSTYNDAGANANDDVDGTIAVEVTGVVNPAIEGIYYLTYTATDAAGNTSEVERIVNIIDTQETSSVAIDMADLTIEMTDGFSVVTPNEVIALDSATESLDVAQNDTESNFVAMLVNADNVPIMMGVNRANIQSEISVDSTAVVFVLRQSNFIGIEITDYQAITSRISAHEKFDSLKAIITRNINTSSPCPLKPECNYVAEKIAATIAEGIEFSDLVKEQEL